MKAEERTYLLPTTATLNGSDVVEHEGEKPDNSWISTAFLISAAMAGAGMLGLPGAMNTTGWSGIALLVICCVIAVYTGKKLGDTMQRIPGVRDYAEVGERAFGGAGRFASQFAVYVSSTGVAVIFLVLMGLLMNGIFPKIPHGFWTLVLGVVLIPIVALPRTMSEAKWMGYLALGATLFVAIAVAVVAFAFIDSPLYPAFVVSQNVTHTAIRFETMATGFGVFTFAFGTHTLFPSLYAKLLQPELWTRSVSVSYFLVLLLYIFIGCVGYAVYGSSLANDDTILTAISNWTSIGPVLPIMAQAAIVIHVAMACPLIINPTFLAIEYKWTSLSTNFPKRILVRGLVFSSLIIIALFFPYFMDIMALISDISISLAVYILPPLFYWKICRPPKWECVLLVGTIIFGLFGSGVGIYTGIDSLVTDIRKNPNPFNGLFHFG